MTDIQVAKPVVVSLKDLKNGIDENTLYNAFGPHSLGILVVKGLDDAFMQLRHKVLQKASILANLPEEELRRLESEEAMYLIGWSRGKEKLAGSEKPDYFKGSYYINCAFHKDRSLEGPLQDLSERFESFKGYTAPNIWPSKNIESLKDFEEECKQLCDYIIDVAEQVANNCDNYISKHFPDIEKGLLERIVRTSTCTKARLLHYYPSNTVAEEDADAEKDSNWCGEHLDHSCLTGLTSALYLDQSEEQPKVLDHSPDPDAGLYIKSRNSDIKKVNIPSDCLAFQTGSALEVISQGKFKAVPHFVKGTRLPNISRNTIAVFCQPDLDEQISSQNFAEYARSIVEGNLAP